MLVVLGSGSALQWGLHLCPPAAEWSQLSPSWGFSRPFPARRKRKTRLCRAVEEPFVCLGLGRGPGSVVPVLEMFHPPNSCSLKGANTNVSEAGRVWSSRNGVSPTLSPSHMGIQVGTSPSCSVWWEQLLPRCPELLGIRREEDESSGWSKDPALTPSLLPGLGLYTWRVRDCPRMLS